MIRATALILSLVASPALAADAPRVDFRGAWLGMTLEEFKAAPPPPQLFHAESRATCSAQRTMWAPLTDSEIAAGVTLCVYGYPVAGVIGRDNMRIGDHEITGATYNFHNGRLFRIDITAQLSARLDMEEGLKAKFGVSGAAGDGQVINGFGNALPQVVRVWKIGDARVDLLAPSRRSDLMTVTFVDTLAEAEVRKAMNAADPNSRKL